MAQESPANQELLSFEVIAEGLSDPGSLTIRPGGSRSGPDLLLAERQAGRVLGIATKSDKPEAIVVLEGFDHTRGPAPTSLVFRSRNRLLAALPGSADTPPVVAEYDLDDDQLPMSSDDRQVVLNYETSQPVSFASLDFDRGVVFAATRDLHWLLRGKISSNSPQPLKQFINTHQASGFGNPTAVVFSNKGYIAVAQSGRNDSGETARLVFYHPTNQIAEPLMVLDTGLARITDLAYSPSTGNLFATSHFPKDPERSGLYRLEAKFDASRGQQFCTAVMIAKLLNPSSIAFAFDGSIYLSTGASGQLLRAPAGL